MYLKSISLQGFKSFAKKVKLDLSSSVTGVVGPNGSGKSNVAEAIRFVLGEQSMKGLRSKSGSDLIFKGSPQLAPLSRAFVSISLDNRHKNIDQQLLVTKGELSDTLHNFINLDEIILTREIYSDGVSEYLINNIKVRLKDVQELLALANISAAGHTIVNQGEADRILLANNIERRETIENALGLRIYHLRIKESLRKLDKVTENLEKIESNRKENLPQLNYLKKQVSELEKRETEINYLSKMLKVYLGKEDLEIANKKKEIGNLYLEKEIAIAEEKLHTLLRVKKNETENLESQLLKSKELEALESELKILAEELALVNQKKEIAYRAILNFEVEIKFLLGKEKENSLATNNSLKREAYSISRNKLDSFLDGRESLWKDIFNFNQASKYLELTQALAKAETEEKEFFLPIKNSNSTLEQVGSNLNIDYQPQIETLREKKLEEESILSILEKNLLEKANLKKVKEIELNKLHSQERVETYKLDNEILQLKLDLEKLYAERNTLKLKQESLKNQETNFENLLQEMTPLIGHKALQYRAYEKNPLDLEEKEIENTPKVELSKKIERSKIRIEESGVLNSLEVLEEYQTLSERDTFLVKEISDLETSRQNLEKLIQDLKNTLALDFETGLQKINQNFNDYFKEIFPGGNASLTLATPPKPNSLEDESLEENEHLGELGVEISVHLPQKKIKDLQMLSGGERALSSIALIFAMSSINYPPFMVLDETDAALDEANARKYGKMIRRLAENSKLLVITHNRETMNQCDVLYGVTVGFEGCSKLLSIKFDEATEYAK